MTNANGRERGCLGAAELAQVAHAAAGRVPPELAGHLAGCAACQRRLLEVDLPPRRPAPAAATLRQRLARALVVLVAILLALYSMWRLVA